MSIARAAIGSEKAEMIRLFDSLWMSDRLEEIPWSMFPATDLVLRQLKPNEKGFGGGGMKKTENKETGVRHILVGTVFGYYDVFDIREGNEVVCFGRGYPYRLPARWKRCFDFQDTLSLRDMKILLGSPEENIPNIGVSMKLMYMDFAFHVADRANITL